MGVEGERERGGERNVDLQNGRLLFAATAGEIRQYLSFSESRTLISNNVDYCSYVYISSDFIYIIFNHL